VVRFNPGVLSAERLRDVAAGNVIGARAIVNPTINYSRGDQRPLAATTALPGFTQSFGVSQLIENPAIRRARREAALSGQTAVGNQVGVRRNELVAQVRTRAYTYLLRQAEAVAAGEAVALLQQVNNRVRARVDSGEAPRYELIKADAEVVSARSQQQTSLLLAEQSAIELNRLAAGALPPRWTLNENLTGDTSGRDLDRLRQQAFDTNPELRVLQAEFDRARSLLAGARAERWPGVTLSYSQNRDPEVRQNIVGVTVQVPIFDQRNGPIAAADAELARARVQLDGRRAELEQQVYSAFKSLEMAQLRVKALSEAAVPDAEAALRVADAAYRFGERGILDVLDAQRVLRAIRADLLVARYQVQSAQIELDQLAGRRSDVGQTAAAPAR
jgi:cobalt-zinc-cadmium efflux system outer membrane protein